MDSIKEWVFQISLPNLEFRLCNVLVVFSYLSGLNLIIWTNFKSNTVCYVAGAETKRDWLIHGHVALDKCNVSLGQ